MSPEFRAGERDYTPRHRCTECGKRAEGNHSWDDGSGEICDACAQADTEFDVAGAAHYGASEWDRITREQAADRGWACLVERSHAR